MPTYDQLNPPADTPLDMTGEVSLVQQQFRDEADINILMDRYQVTGVLSPGTMDVREAAFGNFTAFSNYVDLEEVLVFAQQAFLTLPADIRANFNNDLAQLVTWLENPANLDSAINLGIITGPLSSGHTVIPAPDTAAPGKSGGPMDPGIRATV